VLSEADRRPAIAVVECFRPGSKAIGDRSSATGRAKFKMTVSSMPLAAASRLRQGSILGRAVVCALQFVGASVQFLGHLPKMVRQRRSLHRHLAQSPGAIAKELHFLS